MDLMEKQVKGHYATHWSSDSPKFISEGSSIKTWTLNSYSKTPTQH